MHSTSQPRSDFARLMSAVQTGDADATRKLFEEYGPYIIRAVRRRMSPSLRSQFDSLDFTQDVWASFYANAAARYELTNRGQLIGLLTKMARNKVIEAVRRRIQAESPKFTQISAIERKLDGSVQLPSPQQTPSQIMMDQEAWDALLASQPPVYRRVLLMLRNGKTHERIAETLKISIRTVRRVANKLEA